MFRENFHTHTIYCDGKNTAREMIEQALSLKFDALGFSGHAHTGFPSSWSMTEENTEKYIEEITALKSEYSDRIRIYLGTELDYFSIFSKERYDYTIGSVHYLECDGEFWPVDSSAKEQIECAEKYFGGSLYNYAGKFFEYAGDVIRKTDADIIGHFDLVTKFNENNALFDVSDKRYINAWIDAADRLIETGRPFEINTGAIARGLRTSPYPAMDMTEYINSKGGCFIVTSDCHYREKLDWAFEDTYKVYSKFRIISFDELIRSRE